jgi:glutathione S-transferase
MMKLYASGPSPFVRKVQVVAHEVGLIGQVQTVLVQTSPVAPDAELGRKNPLGKIPALELPSGEVLYDSHVIALYLAESAGNTGLLPAQGAARYTALRLEALADGILDAGILVRYEGLLRPAELRWPAWVDAQAKKIYAALDALEAEVSGFANRVDLGTLSVACALAWLEFRAPVPGLRDGRPALFAWHDQFCTRPSMQATVPVA